MNSVPKLFSCCYADCWTENHFSTEFGVLTPNHTHSHTLFWGCVSRWFGRALAWHARGQRFDSAILHQKSTVLRLKYGAFLFAFLEVASRISQMLDFAGAWTATPNSCCFVVFEKACWEHPNPWTPSPDAGCEILVRRQTAAILITAILFWKRKPAVWNDTAGFERKWSWNARKILYRPRCQMSRSYSAMVRSLEKKPALAMFTRHFLRQPSGSQA